MASSTSESIPLIRIPALPPSHSISSLSSKGPGHQHHRQLSTGPSIASHRVTRRKSMSSNTTTNIAAVAQAVKEAAEAQMSSTAVIEIGGALGKHKGPRSDAARSQTTSTSIPSPGFMPNSTANIVTTPVLGTATANEGIHHFGQNHPGLLHGSVVADGHALEVSRAPRGRRASEGAGVLGGTSGKIGRMRSGSELKCDKCGKGYKHSSCLTKHLWEHTPEWSYTSKLLISKHQQVQLLEAASILVSMNPTDSSSCLSPSNMNIEPSSSSAHDSSSSPPTSEEDTTPPPLMSSSTPASSSSTTPRGIRSGSGKLSGKQRYHYGHSRSYNPPPASSSSRSQLSEEDALAAAIELLSCSFNTSGGSLPRVPLEDLGELVLNTGRGYLGPLGDVVEMKREEGEGDVEMEDLGRGVAGGGTEPGVSADEDEGVFGRMEE